MKITFLSPPLNMGGGTKVIGIYASALQKMGHEVVIITPKPADISLSTKLRSLATGSGWPKPPLSTHVQKDIEVRVLDAHRPICEADVPDGDVVVATWWETSEWAYSLSPSKGAKVYFIQHHEVFPHLPERSRETYLLPMKKIVIAKWLQNLMASEYGDPNADLVLNSVDRSQFYSPARDKQIHPTVGLLYASVGFKGLDISLQAIDLLRRKHPRLKVISFGSERPKRHLPLPSGARFYYRPPMDRIRDIYSSCDVWLTASRTEGFNLPALEAMACGTPVVSTPTGWLIDGIVDGVNGKLATDAPSLADAADWILSRHEGEWRHLSSAAYQTQASPSWGHSAKLFERSLMGAVQRVSRAT